MLQLAKQVTKGITGSASGLTSCSYVSLLLCSMTQPSNALRDKGTNSMLKHIISAQLVGLDTDAQLASTPLDVVLWTS